jgi:hypothetical protein
MVWIKYSTSRMVRYEVTLDEDAILGQVSSLLQYGQQR